MSAPADRFVPINVTARRNLKGARVRSIAVQSINDDAGISFYEPGGVAVHFATTDGLATVFLPPAVVARIKGGPKRLVPLGGVPTLEPRLDAEAARQLPARDELERVSGRRGGE